MLYIAHANCTHVLSIVHTVLIGLHPRVGKFIWSLKRFDSLWQNDLHATHKKYLESGPSDDQYKAMVEELLDSENAVSCCYINCTPELAALYNTCTAYWYSS